MLALIAKSLIFIFYINQNRNHGLDGFLGFMGGDSESYFQSVENLIHTGNYTPDNRMPGYAVFYLPLYLLFSKSVALNIIIFLQLIFAALATYCLALIARAVFGSDRYFYATFYLYAISTYSNLFDAVALTESFTTSFLIFCVYCLYKWKSTKANLWILLCCILTTEVIFLRPVFAPIVALFAFFIFYHSDSRPKYKLVFIFVLPFLVTDGLWTARNYLAYHKLSPLIPKLYSAGSERNFILPVWSFIQSWGGNIVYWEPGAEITWFGYGQKNIQYGKGVTNDAKLPKYIYTSQFNEDSLLNIRSKVIALVNDSTLSNEVITEYQNYIASRLKAYTLSIKKEKPFLYYCKAPLTLTKRFLLHSGTYNLFHKSSAELNKVELTVKIFYSLFYLFVLATGFIGLILLLKKRILFPALPITGTVIYTILIHPVILRLTELRYFVPAWPFLLICSVYSLIWIYQLIRGKPGAQT